MELGGAGWFLVLSHLHPPSTGLATKVSLPGQWLEPCLRHVAMENPMLWWQKMKDGGGGEEEIPHSGIVGALGGCVATSRLIYTPAGRRMDGKVCVAA